MFSDLIGPKTHHSHEDVILGLGKGAAITMFVYYFFLAFIFMHGEKWKLINTSWGYWYLVEVIGFVLIPCFMFAYGVRNRKFGVIKTAAVMTVLGVILNRQNICLIAYNWYVPLSEKYWPAPMELIITASIILTEIWAFRWMVNRMPVLKEPPAWAVEKEH